MLEIKNEISDTINKITEHLEFLGYKIEKDKELLLAYHDTNNNTQFNNSLRVYDLEEKYG